MEIRANKGNPGNTASPLFAKRQTLCAQYECGFLTFLSIDLLTSYSVYID